MPLATAADEAALDHAIDGLFQAAPAGRPATLDEVASGLQQVETVKGQGLAQ